MRFPFAAIAAAILILAGAALHPLPASASGGCADVVNHNGSDVVINMCPPGSIRITYNEPRPLMARNGVRPGTLLFLGTSNGRAVQGNARVFKRGCGPASYWVTGNYRNNGALVMVGQAPVRDANCNVVRYRRDVLVFDPPVAP